MKIQNIKYAIIFNIKCNNQVKRGEKMKTDMQAMVIHHYGKGPVSLERMPLPSMNPNEVRVKIKAASINQSISKFAMVV